jgi:predicted RNase H-like HicB family nuclease
MKKKFSATVYKDGKYYVAQCLEVDIASHGKTRQEALKCLSEAIELYFEEPTATVYPEIWEVQVNLPHYAPRSIPSH